MEMSRPALPPEALNTPDLAGKIEDHCNEFADPVAYMRRLRRIYDDTGYDRWLGFVAYLIEPTTGHAFEDPNATRAGNFYAGGLVGLRAVDHAVGASVLQRMVLPGCTQEVQGDLDLDKLDSLRRAVFHQGQRGYAVADAFHPMFTAWSPHIPPERYNEDYLHAGFGFVHGFATRAMGQQYELDQLIAAAELSQTPSDSDWDGALMEMLGPIEK